MLTGRLIMGHDPLPPSKPEDYRNRDSEMEDDFKKYFVATGDYRYPFVPRKLQD